jgi:hypothetical protein
MKKLIVILLLLQSCDIEVKTKYEITSISQKYVLCDYTLKNFLHEDLIDSCGKYKVGDIVHIVIQK